MKKQKRNLARMCSTISWMLNLESQFWILHDQWLSTYREIVMLIVGTVSMEVCVDKLQTRIRLSLDVRKFSKNFLICMRLRLPVVVYQLISSIICWVWSGHMTPMSRLLGTQTDPTSTKIICQVSKKSTLSIFTEMQFQKRKILKFSNQPSRLSQLRKQKNWLVINFSFELPWIRTSNYLTGLTWAFLCIWISCYQEILKLIKSTKMCLISCRRIRKPAKDEETGT